MTRRLGRQVVSVLRAPFKVDEYGNRGAERDWSLATRASIAGCSVQAEPSSEFTRDREAVVIRKHLFAPPTADLRASDRVEVDGETFDVEGDPQLEVHGTPTDHLFALLRRSEDY